VDARRRIVAGVKVAERGDDIADRVEDRRETMLKLDADAKREFHRGTVDGRRKAFDLLRQMIKLLPY